MLLRGVILLALACGFSAARQQAPLSVGKPDSTVRDTWRKAVDKAVTSVRAQSAVVPGENGMLPWPVPLPNIPTAAVSENPRKQCSIPLTEYRIPPDAHYSMKELRLPAIASDAMPILRMPVCGEPTPESK